MYVLNLSLPPPLSYFRPPPSLAFIPENPPSLSPEWSQPLSSNCMPHVWTPNPKCHFTNDNFKVFGEWTKVWKSLYYPIGLWKLSKGWGESPLSNWLEIQRNLPGFHSPPTFPVPYAGDRRRNIIWLWW